MGVPIQPRILLWKNKIWEASGSNLGDLAIITATVDALRREIPGVQIVMLSDDPAHTESLYEGVTAERFSFAAYVRAIRDADLVVLGGGTLFTDATSMAVLVNTSAAFIAKLYGTPVALYGVASGFMRATSRMLVRGALKRTSLACLRDPESVAELTPLAPASLKLESTGDVAFSLRVPEPAPERINRVIIAPRRVFHYGNTILPFALRKRLGMLPAGYYEKLDAFKSLLAETADHLVDAHGCEVVFLPMYSAIGPAEGTSGYLKKEFSSRDDQVCREIHERMARKDSARVFISDRPREVLSLIASSRMLMGVPLHSLILAHVAETPFVGLAYQGKVARFMRDAGLEAFIIPVDSMDCPLERDEFVSKVDACLAEEPALRERLSQGNATIRQTVDLPASRIARLLAEEA
jgi:polysaccharide pyruvyl transferase WcaK-like protein